MKESNYMDKNKNNTKSSPISLDAWNFGRAKDTSVTTSWTIETKQSSSYESRNNTGNNSNN